MQFSEQKDDWVRFAAIEDQAEISQSVLICFNAALLIKELFHSIQIQRPENTPCQENFPNAVGAVTKPLGDG